MTKKPNPVQRVVAADTLSSKVREGSCERTVGAEAAMRGVCYAAWVAVLFEVVGLCFVIERDFQEACIALGAACTAMGFAQLLTPSRIAAGGNDGDQR